MLLSPALLFFYIAANEVFWKLIRRFGGFMFFPIGLLDNSVVPLPGSMDALLIFLSASHKPYWWYYALMATAGSVVGSWPTYQLGKKGGEEALDKKLGNKRAKKVCDTFQKYGFWSIVFGALAPPPVPTAAFVATAGALRYSGRRFVMALSLGRVARFALVAWIASRYGDHLFTFFGKYYRPALWTLLVLGVAGGIVAAYYYRRERKRKKAEDAGCAVPENRAA